MKIRRRKKCSSSKHESLSLTRKSYLSITNKWQVFQTLLRDKQEKQELICILPKEFSIYTVQVYTSQHTFPYTMFEWHCFTSIIRAVNARKDKCVCAYVKYLIFNRVLCFCNCCNLANGWDLKLCLKKYKVHGRLIRTCIWSVVTHILTQRNAVQPSELRGSNRATRSKTRRSHQRMRVAIHERRQQIWIWFWKKTEN